MTATTTIVAPTPFVGGHVERIRQANDWSAQLGVPAHVTLLGPFLEPSALDETVVRRLEHVFGRHAAFATSFTRVVRVGNVACLLPDDPRPFEHLHEALRQQWPQFPRRSLHQITVARDIVGREFDRLAAELAPLLPLSGSIHQAVLFAADGEGPARPLDRFDLG